MPTSTRAPTMTTSELSWGIPMPTCVTVGQDARRYKDLPGVSNQSPRWSAIAAR